MGIKQAPIIPCDEHQVKCHTAFLLACLEVLQLVFAAFSGTTMALQETYQRDGRRLDQTLPMRLWRLGSGRSMSTGCLSVLRTTQQQHPCRGPLPLRKIVEVCVSLTRKFQLAEGIFNSIPYPISNQVHL